jgi:hypothetical protein
MGYYSLGSFAILQCKAQLASILLSKPQCSVAAVGASVLDNSVPRVTLAITRGPPGDELNKLSTTLPWAQYLVGLQSMQKMALWNCRTRKPYPCQSKGVASDGSVESWSQKGLLAKIKAFVILT